ncbi:hypothetical protein F5883DRAFT_13794 [Diaporthe sp. PMI_573]|nr:hypothetical protein F5883DRAFT_13794 [Diaporthaceae sp. PMI_573]
MHVLGTVYRDHRWLEALSTSCSTFRHRCTTCLTAQFSFSFIHAIPFHFWEGIEGRRDITSRREGLEMAKRSGDKQEIAKAKGALDQRRRGLYDLLVMDAREKYFATANTLRSEGESTAQLRDRSRPSNKRCELDRLDIGGLMLLWTGEAGFGNRTGASKVLVFDLEAEDRSEKAMLWLHRSVSKTWTLLALAPPSLPISAPQTAKQNEPLKYLLPVEFLDAVKEVRTIPVEKNPHAPRPLFRHPTGGCVSL